MPLGEASVERAVEAELRGKRDLEPDEGGDGAEAEVVQLEQDVEEQRGSVPGEGQVVQEDSRRRREGVRLQGVGRQVRAQVQAVQAEVPRGQDVRVQVGRGRRHGEHQAERDSVLPRRALLSPELRAPQRKR